MGYERQNRPLLGVEFNDPAPAAGQIYILGNSTATTIATPNVPVKADLGTVIFETLKSGNVEFNATTKRTEIGQGRKRVFSCNVRARLLGTTADVVGVYVAKNGTALLQSFAYGEIHSGSGTDNLASTCLLELEAGDYVEIFVVNELASNNVTVQDASLEIHPV